VGDKFKQRKPIKVEVGLTIDYRKEPPYEVTEPAGSTGPERPEHGPDPTRDARAVPGAQRQIH